MHKAKKAMNPLTQVRWLHHGPAFNPSEEGFVSSPGFIRNYLILI